MATGKSPWADFSGDHVSVLHKIAYSVESPAIPSCLSDQARDFLEKCLRRDPKLRWTTTQLLEHPFLAESTTSDESKQGKESNSWSPTCVLDDHEMWSTLEETELSSVCTSPGRKTMACRIDRLSLVSGRSDWTWDEDWITSRENYDDNINESVAVINNNGNGKQNIFSSIYFKCSRFVSKEFENKKLE